MYCNIRLLEYKFSSSFSENLKKKQQQIGV